MARKATTRSQVQAKQKAAAKKKAAPKKPVRGQRAATSAAKQKKAPAKKPTAKKPNRMVVKPKKNSTRTPKRVATTKINTGNANSSSRAQAQVKAQQAATKPSTPKTKINTGNANSSQRAASQLKAQQARTAGTTKVAAKGAEATRLRTLLKRAGVVGLAAMTLSELKRQADKIAKERGTTRNANPIGRAAAKTQAASRTKPKADAPMKKEVVKPRKKPVKVDLKAAARKKEREDAMKERLAARRAEAAAAKKKKLPKNVVTDSRGKAVKSGSGNVTWGRDYSKSLDDWDY